MSGNEGAIPIPVSSPRPAPLILQHEFPSLGIGWVPDITIGEPRPSASSTRIAASPPSFWCKVNYAIALRFCWGLFSRKSVD